MLLHVYAIVASSGGASSDDRTELTVDNSLLTGDADCSTEEAAAAAALAQLGDDEEDDEADEGVRRIRGSWEQVHPASAGVESQAGVFLVSAYSAARDHPAAYAVHDPEFLAARSGASPAMPADRKAALPTGAALLALGLKTMISMPGEGADESQERAGSFDAHRNDPNSKVPTHLTLALTWPLP
jgi:hypothetical protein